MKQLSLNAKIGLVVAMLVVGNVVIAVLALDRMNALNEALASITGVSVPRMSQGFALHDVMRRVAIAERALLAEDTKDGAARVVRELGELSTQFEKTLDAAYAEANVLGKQRLLAARDAYSKWREVEKEVQTHVLDGHTAAAMQLANDKSRKLMQVIQTELTQFVNVNKNAMDEDTERADLEYAHARGVLTTGLVAIVLFGVALAFSILRALSHSITQVIERLNASSGKTTLGAQQIAMSSADLSGSVTRQARELDKTSRKVREMNNAVKKNAANATKACEVSLYSESAAKKGKNVVEHMITAITEINEANTNIAKEINESNRRVAEIVRVIGEIGEKTRIINEIVFQTKLLSFNASAEATRAGENGRGFSIIADEIRTLAHSSGVAARDITLLLDGSVAKVDEIVSTTRARVETLVTQCNEKVEAGTRVAAQCNHVLEEIVSNVGAVNRMAFEISNASDEQAQSIADLLKTVKRIEETTNENAMVAVETSKVSDQLTDESKGMRQVVSMLFRTIRGGAKVTVGGETRRGFGQREPLAREPEAHPMATFEDFEDKVIALNPGFEEAAPAATGAEPEPAAEPVAAVTAADGNDSPQAEPVELTKETPVITVSGPPVPPPAEPVVADSSQQKVA